MSSFFRDDKLPIQRGGNSFCQEKLRILLHCGIMFKAIALEGKKPLTAVFGKKPIPRNVRTDIMEELQTVYVKRNELLTRMLAETCELCESQHNVEAHHVRRLADLKKHTEKPHWMKKMIAIRRKTLFVGQKVSYRNPQREI